jgi:hypothetical protein
MEDWMDTDSMRTHARPMLPLAATSQQRYPPRASRMRWSLMLTTAKPFRPIKVNQHDLHFRCN